jgi:hypothetical protein
MSVPAPIRRDPSETVSTILLRIATGGRRPSMLPQFSSGSVQVFDHDGYFNSTSTASQKHQDTSDYDKDDSQEENPRCRRDKSMSAIRTNTYVQTDVLLASWARLHYGQCILSFSRASTIRFAGLTHLKSIAYITNLSEKAHFTRHNNAKTYCRIST